MLVCELIQQLTEINAEYGDIEDVDAPTLTINGFKSEIWAESLAESIVDNPENVDGGYE